jgi:uncharacterized membrane protein YkvI
MSDEMKNILKIASIYVATIIGAGFASGQEIVQFFSNYNNGGFYGIVLAGLLFAVIGYVVLDKVYTERIKDFDELLFPAVGWVFGWVIEIAVTLFMLSIFCIMIAGAGNIFQDRLNIPYYIGICLMVAICMIALLSETKGIVFISSFIAPILIFGLVAMGVYVIATKNVFVFSVSGDFSKVTKNWFFSSLLYVGYNSIISIVVMSSLFSQLKTRKAAVVGGALGGLILCFIAFILNFIMYVVHPDSLVKEIPLLNISEKYSSFFSTIYAIILFLAMFVSAVTSGYCFIDRVCKKIRLNKKLITLFICILITPLSRLGFSNLISKIYPIFGYVGIFIILVILFQSIRIQRHPKLNK